MSSAGDGFLFTSESVTEGHPDKVADQISDAIVDAALTEDPGSRVAVEALLTTGLVVLAGEITTDAVLDFAAIARRVICEIGYDTGDFGFDGHAVGVITALDRQSPDIARGVAESRDLRAGSTDPLDSVGAGDQGMMFGYATNETPELMPMPIVLAHKLARRLAQVRRNGLLPYLRPDGKTQVTVRYDSGGKPVGVEKVLISTQHEDGVEPKLADALWEQVVTQALPPGLYNAAALRKEFYVNPTGRFVIGGPVGDTGLTGRKIIVDTYGGFARHGGGAFSGKDPSKVDRSASYAARHVAKNIVAAGLADRAEVQVAYAIGVARPLSLLIETFGTEKISRGALTDLVRDRFDLRPAALVEALNLRRPIYRQTAAYGHFGRDEAGFTWENTDKAAVLRAAAGLALGWIHQSWASTGSTSGSRLPPITGAPRPLVRPDRRRTPRRRRDPRLPGSGMSALLLRDLTVERGGRAVVRDVSVEIPAGQVTALLGPNGAGKSTLVLAVGGVLRPKAGAVLLDDADAPGASASTDLTGRRPERIRQAGVAIVPEGRRLLPDLTVADNLRVASYALTREQAQAGRDRVLELFPQLTRRLTATARTLSGGEQQMVVLAQALICQPRYLLIDELSLGLAPVVVSRLIPVIAAVAESGTGVLLIEQFATVALGLAHHAYIMEGGWIRFSGLASELRDHPDRLRSAYLLRGSNAPGPRP